MDGEPEAPPVHKCERCQKIFAQKGNLKRHLARKTPCKPTEDYEPPKELPFVCEHCGRKFARSWNRDRHIREGHCASRRAALVEAFEAAEAQAAPAGGGTTNITNNTQNNTFNIMVQAPTPPPRDFGNEDLTYITPEWMKQVLSVIPIRLGLEVAAPRIARKTMEAVFANPNHPENVTVVLTTPRGRPLIRENGAWKEAPMEEVEGHFQYTTGIIHQRFAGKYIKDAHNNKTDHELCSAVVAGVNKGEYSKVVHSTATNARDVYVGYQGSLPKPGELGPTQKALAPPAPIKFPRQSREEFLPEIVDHHRTNS